MYLVPGIHTSLAADRPHCCWKSRAAGRKFGRCPASVIFGARYSMCGVYIRYSIFNIRYWYSMLDILYSMFDNRRLLSDTCSRCSKKILKLTLLVKEIRIGQTNTSTKSMVRLPLSQMENSDVLNHCSYIVLETAIHCSRRVKC